MTEVQFLEDAQDSLLQIAVIVSRYQGKWVFCKHRQRQTYEVPAGHREPGETILEAARRELYEETGALTYELHPVSVYSVTSDEYPGGYGMVFFAEIQELGPIPPLEIERIELFDAIPSNLTYPLIQPALIHRVQEVFT